MFWDGHKQAWIKDSIQCPSFRWPAIPTQRQPPKSVYFFLGASAAFAFLVPRNWKESREPDNIQTAKCANLLGTVLALLPQFA